MTNEEMQKTMQFILEQQAQFVVNIQKLEEEQTRAVERMTRIEGAIVSVVNLIGKLTTTQEQLAQAQLEMSAKWETRFAELTEAQKQTDERLNALIAVVERYFGDRRNGKAQSPEGGEN
ncbi:MAG: hypothetical protein LC742_10090 [Acidobacteria bacterium]|nr:hypothetical protein [Acidobacteriota bacterium]